VQDVGGGAGVVVSGDGVLVGDFEVTTMSDAGAVIDGPWPIVGQNRPAADVEALMRENLLPEKKFLHGFTAGCSSPTSPRSPIGSAS